MIHIATDKFHAVVLHLVQADYMGDSEVSKDLEIVFWSITSLASASRLIDWPHKSNKLVGYYPIQISIFNLLVVLVLFIIEIFELVPPVADSNF